MNFNSWREFIESESTKPYFRKLWQTIEFLRESKEIFPPRKEVFSCFDKCPLGNVKVVILGQDPYHGVGQAHGMSFSVKKGVKIPPSLQNIYKELHDDLGVKIPNHGNLEKWAEQGVLLLNTTLTVEKGRPASHSNFGWQEFSENVLKLLNNSERPLVFILWGAHAQKAGVVISSSKHLKIESPHPSPFSARRGFFDSKPFSKTNKFLQKTNQEKIDWNL